MILSTIKMTLTIKRVSAYSLELNKNQNESTFCSQMLSQHQFPESKYLLFHAYVAPSNESRV
jgi:hypothetical protein